MKENELMIGDWVEFPIGIDKIVDIVYVGGRGLCASFAASATLIPVEIGKLKPIPLTTEILEKNGFERKLDNDGNHNRFTLTYEHTSFSLLYARSVFQWYCPIDFKYVHELQHALKLCKIEKEIEL